MKQSVVTTSMNDLYLEAEDAFLADLDAIAYRYKYNMEAEDIPNMVFTPTSSKYSPYLPTINVTAIEDGEGYSFICTLQLPQEISSEDLEYSDSFEYLFDQYQNAAKLCKYITSHPFYPGEWVEF